MDINDIVSDVKVYLPSCEIPLIKKMSKKVIQDFCRQTQIWNYSINIEIDKDVTEYFYSVQDASIFRYGKFHDGSTIFFHTTYDLDEELMKITINSNAFLEHYDGQTVYLDVVAIPTMEQDIVPTTRLTEFMSGITSGVIAEIVSIPAKPFTNFDTFSLQKPLYNASITTALNLRRPKKMSKSKRGKRGYK